MPAEWPYTLTIDLINAYKKQEILWNANLPGYRNRSRKDGAWKEIAKEIGAPVSECKKKLESVMASYRRERKKISENTEMIDGDNDEPYTPRWIFWEHLQFIRDYFDNVRRRRHKRPLVVDLTKVSSPSTSAKTKVRADDEFRPSSLEKRLKKEIPSESQSVPVSSEPISVAAKEDDAFDIYGRYVASELRGLDDRALTMVKFKINNAIYEAKMSLHSSSTNERSMNSLTNQRSTNTDRSIDLLTLLTQGNTKLSPHSSANNETT